VTFLVLLFEIKILLCYLNRMPRKARLDAPGALHHIIVRGIERRKIFRDDADRDDFLNRLEDNGDGLSLMLYLVLVARGDL
jgi:hypothetical protein